MDRRSFIKNTAAFATSIPLFNIVRAETLKPVSQRKLRVALIGCGGRMRVLLTKCDKEEIVALVDPDAPQLKRTTDTIYSWGKRTSQNIETKNIKCYADYRVFLNEMGSSVDAAIIASNQQSHAIIAIECMKRGIHVYLEKPICYSVEEADMLAAAQKKYGVVTQAGHHGHSGAFQPLVAEYVQSGALGQIHDVWSWSDRFNAKRKLTPVIDPPKGMDWDLWVGPAEMRPYRFSYLGQRWYDIRGFGNGSLGNMDNHVLDAPFWAMDLVNTPPTSVTMEDMSYTLPESWPTRETITYEFPARPGMDPFKLHWFDGIKDNVEIDDDVQYHYAANRDIMNFPEIVLEIEKKYNCHLGNIGTLFIGEKGILWAGPFGVTYQLVPRTLKRTLPVPPRKFRRVAKGKSHVHEFFDAIREGRKANADFVDYGVPLVKTVLLGNVVALAARDGKPRIEWDGKRVTNNDAANAYCRTTYRKGWEISI